MLSKLSFLFFLPAVAASRVTPEAGVPVPAWACSNVETLATDVAPDALKLHAHETALVGEYQVEAVNGDSLFTLMSAKNKDLLVVFYAPWCPHCKTFVMHDGMQNRTNAPLENFNREMIASSGPKVVKFDGVASAVPSQFSVKYYPSVFFVSKATVITPFAGDPHDLDALRAFVKSSVSPPTAALNTKRVGLKRAKLDINQKVFIENAAVLGDSAGEGALNTCRAFTAAHVTNPAAPAVKVCGTGIKATVYMRGRCEEYYTHQEVIGKCDSGMPASTCDVFSPADKAAFGAYQSYKIEQC